MPWWETKWRSNNHSRAEFCAWETDQFVLFLQQHKSLIYISSCVSHTETQQYFGRKSCGWAVFCCCFEASQWPSCLLNESPVIPFTLVCLSAPSNNKSQPATEIWISPPKFSQFLSVFLFCFFSFPFSVDRSVWFRGPLLWQFCSAVTSVIDRTMCHKAGDLCSWKYIICNFSWVNIAGSLVKQRDKLFWERKCCLSFLKAGKKFPSTSGTHKVLSRLPNNESTVEEAGPEMDHVL